MSYQIVVCAGIVPDPLQSLEPINGPGGAALKNELMLPHVLDPWAAHALYEAAHLAKKYPGSKVYLISVARKAKLQQVMMTIAQRVPLELIALDAPANGFVESADIARLLADAILAILGLDRNRLLVFGGWESASHGAGTTMQIVGEILGIADQFQGVDRLRVDADGRMEILERVEGGQHQVSILSGPPAVLGWATGELPEPPNSPQTGMQNMRGILPALKKAKAVNLQGGSAVLKSVELPKLLRDTRIVKNIGAAGIALEIVEWLGN